MNHDPDKALAQLLTPETIAVMARNLQQGESLLAERRFLKPADRADLFEQMEHMYKILNGCVGLICLRENYPARQWEWKDSKPLEILAAMPGLEWLPDTEWYQRQLGSCLDPTEHSWFTIPTFAESPRYSSPDAIAVA
jgi:hypothetical protein